MQVERSALAAIKAAACMENATRDEPAPPRLVSWAKMTYASSRGEVWRSLQCFSKCNAMQEGRRGPSASVHGSPHALSNRVACKNGAPAPPKSRKSPTFPPKSRSLHNFVLLYKQNPHPKPPTTRCIRNPTTSSTRIANRSIHLRGAFIHTLGSSWLPNRI